MKKLPYAVVATIVLATLFASQEAVASVSSTGLQQSTVILDGKSVSVLPYKVSQDVNSHSNTVFVPLRYLLTLLRMNHVHATWDGRLHTLKLNTAAGWPVDLSKPHQRAGSLVVELNGVAVQDMPYAIWADPVTKLNTTYVPLWYFMHVFKRLGFEAHWQNSQMLLVSPTSVDLAATTIEISPQVGQGTNNTTVHVDPVGYSGANLGLGETVLVFDGSTWTPATWNAQQGDYEATFTEETPGSVTFTASVNGVTVPQDAVTDVVQVASPSLSQVSVPFSAIVGQNNVIVSVLLRDVTGAPFGPGHTVTVSDGTQTVTATWDSVTGSYLAQFSEETVGVAHFAVQVDGTPLNVTSPLTTFVDPVPPPPRLNVATSTINAPAIDEVGQPLQVAIDLKDQYGAPFSNQSNVTITDTTSGVQEPAVWDAANQDYEATFSPLWNTGTVDFTGATGSQAIGAGAQTRVEIPSVIAMVPGEVNGSAHLVSGDYPVTLETVDSNGDPMALTGDVVLNMQDVAKALGGSVTVTGFSQTYGGTSSTTVSLPSGSSSTRVYADLSVASVSGGVTSTRVSLAQSTEPPQVNNITYSQSQQLITINFDESMNPSIVTNATITSHIAVNSGYIRVAGANVVWGNDNETLKIYSQGPISPSDVTFWGMQGQFGQVMPGTTYLRVSIVS